MKAAVKAALFGGPTTSQWLAIALERPGDEVEVTLRCAGREWDVSENCVVASLRPFAAAIGCSESESELLAAHDSELRFHEAHGAGRLLAVIELHRTGSIALNGEWMVLFAAKRSRIVCVAPMQRWARSLWQSYRQRRAHERRDPYNFDLSGTDLDSLLAFYVRPRPVVLVSVAHGDASNLFPMDLIGPINRRYFTLALRATSPAVALIRDSRRLAICGVPARYAPLAYQLGKHHRLRTIDWDSLPVETMLSPRFGLRVPCFASRVRELELESWQACGSHCLFITRPVEDRGFSREPQLCHVPGILQTYRERRGRPFHPAEV